MARVHQDPLTQNPDSCNSCGFLEVRNDPRKLHMEYDADSIDSALCVPGSRLLRTGFSCTSCTGLCLLNLSFCLFVCFCFFFFVFLFLFLFCFFIFYCTFVVWLKIHVADTSLLRFRLTRRLRIHGRLQNFGTKSLKLGCRCYCLVREWGKKLWLWVLDWRKVVWEGSKMVLNWILCGFLISWKSKTMWKLLYKVLKMLY